MKPLLVEYQSRAPAQVPQTTLVIRMLSAEMFEPWKKAINTGMIDQVIIAGPAVCTGWRIFVDREVKFMERPILGEQDAIAQRQAQMRIVTRGEMAVETISPYNLIQEWVDRDKHYPWRVLVTCTLLTRTHGRVVRNVIEVLFQRCPSPRDMLEQDITDILQPLGLKNMRSKRLREITTDYLNKVPFDQMRGLGQYAHDALKLFCWGQTEGVSPNDTWLTPYLEWRRQGGRAVTWDREGYEAWRAL